MDADRIAELRKYGASPTWNSKHSYWEDPTGGMDPMSVDDLMECLNAIEELQAENETLERQVEDAWEHAMGDDL